MRISSFSIPLLFCAALSVCFAEDPARPDLSQARYFRAMQRAEAELIQTLDSQLQAAIVAGDADTIEANRAALWSYLWDGPRSFEVRTQLPPALLEQYEKLDDIEWADLKASLERDEAAAVDAGDETQAEVLRRELQSFESGAERPGPSDLQPSRYRCENFSWENGGILASGVNLDIPDALSFKRNGHRIELAGTYPAAVTRSENRRFGHLGNMFLIPAGNQTGYLGVKVPTSADETTYFMCAERQGRALAQFSLWLEPDTLYRWQLLNEDDFVIVTIESENGDMRQRGKFRRSDDLSIGFAATVRRAGDSAHLAVLLSDVAGEVP